MRSVHTDTNHCRLVHPQSPSSPLFACSGQTSIVIGDPSYFPDKTKKVGQVVRAICLMDHPIPQTNDNVSCQIIIPANQAGRKHGWCRGLPPRGCAPAASDSFPHTRHLHWADLARPQRGRCRQVHCHLQHHRRDWLVVLLRLCEWQLTCMPWNSLSPHNTFLPPSPGNPEAELDLAFKTIGPVLEKFVAVDDLLEAADDGKASGIFVTKSYDATSHFQSTCQVRGRRRAMLTSAVPCSPSPLAHILRRT